MSSMKKRLAVNQCNPRGTPRTVSTIEELFNDLKRPCSVGVDDFDYVRKFHANNGFEAEARIRDFYESGVDKVVFRKSLIEAVRKQSMD